MNNNIYEWMDVPMECDLEQLMDFDSSACASGHKQFMRLTTPIEQNVAPEPLPNCCIVIEIVPGVRVRNFVDGVKPGKG